MTFWLLVLGRMADLLTTFYFNPALDREANPLVRIFGGGSATLILMSLLQVTVLGAGLLLLYRNGARWQHSREALRLASVALAWALIFGSCAAVGAWFALAGPADSMWRGVYTGVSLGPATAVPYAVALLGFFVGAFLFLRGEYASRSRPHPPAASKTRR
jgi:hypothetical protein